MLVFLSIICHYVYFGIFSKKLLEQFFFAFQEFIANYSSIKHVPKSYWCHLYYILHNARWMMYYGLKGRASAYINEPSDTQNYSGSLFLSWILTQSLSFQMRLCTGISMWTVYITYLLICTLMCEWRLFTYFPIYLLQLLYVCLYLFQANSKVFSFPEISTFQLKLQVCISLFVPHLCNPCLFCLHIYF